MPLKPYKIKPGHITTRWAHELQPALPLPEYPRPQLYRPAWRNLNGIWDYAITGLDAPQPDSFQGQILVPFPIESALSGVKQPLQPDERLWYHRIFSINPDWQGGCVFLHFGGVDWYCQVFINDQLVGEHMGGYDPFSLDITDVIGVDSNDLVVSVHDPTDTQPIQRGKQVLDPGFIWYTAVSGIWQTVWLEHVPVYHIESIKITPDIDDAAVKINANISQPLKGAVLEVDVRKDGKCICKHATDLELPVLLSIPQPKLWSPESPHLYDLILTLKRGDVLIDQVHSYFGMRKFSLENDQNGRKRFCLNNEPTFLYGPLDQGYWPDGLYTPPTDEAMQQEIGFIKGIGCNMLRKHMKVEPARYYYHCDRIGLIVWQDMVSGGISPRPVWFFFANKLKRLRDDRFYWRLGRKNKLNRAQFLLEYQRIIAALFNTVSIAVWGPFNEGWGQFDAANIARMTHNLDPSRLVDHASGWFDQGAGDFKSEHHYFKPLPDPQPDPSRAWVLSEFGGYSLKLSGHVWEPNKDFGYKKFSNQEELTQGYIQLLDEQLIPWIKEGLSAAIYTQTTDVETELNGFLTYDREIIKMDLVRIQKAHQRIFQESQANRITPPAMHDSSI